jgi:hypothetical protein
VKELRPMKGRELFTSSHGVTSQRAFLQKYLCENVKSRLEIRIPNTKCQTSFQGIFRHVRVVSKVATWLSHFRPHVCPSVRMYQRCSHWTNFREIFYWSRMKIYREIPSLNLDEKTDHFICRRLYLNRPKSTLF